MGHQHHHPRKKPVRHEHPNSEQDENSPKPGQPQIEYERRLTSRDQLSAMRALKDLEHVGDKERKRRAERSLDLGLEAAKSVQDRRISLFVRGDQPQFAGINTFAHTPYCENINEVGQYDVAFVGAPLDTGTTYRTGTRFGPQGVRRISATYDSYSPDMGLDLREQLKICDAGDIFVIPANLEKSFDQIDLAVSFLHKNGVFPVICGGDHSIGYPDLRGTAPYIDGTIGIIHFDRHIDTLDRDMDERMHTTPWFHATNIPNCPPSNLVQVGIGGWIGNRGGVKVARERNTTVISVFDVDEWGIDECIDIALEQAWKGAKAVFLSFDIDVVDPGFAPGTGTPEPGGLLPREALRAVRRVAREGLCGLEVVEIAPPYDVADITSHLGARIMMDVLGTLVQHGHLGRIYGASG
jgi:agmatinase